MKKIVYIILLFVISFLSVTSCKKTEKKIIGKWKVYYADVYSDTMFTNKSLPDDWMASIRASSTLAALTPFAWACSSSLVYSTELYPVAFVMMVSIRSPFSGIRPWPDCR